MRDPTIPGVNDIGFPPTTVWEGVTYADPIVYKDFSTRMSLGENAADRGYVVHKRYSWKVGRVWMHTLEKEGRSGGLLGQGVSERAQGWLEGCD